MKHLGRSLVTLGSLLVIHAGCGGDDEGDSFTRAQAIEATKVVLLEFHVGAQLADYDLEGESGDFDRKNDCTGGGTAQYTGTLTVSDDEQAGIAMDAKEDGCSWSWSTVDATVDGTVHFEGTIESFDISGRYTFSGDTLSGDCSFDAMATLSADGESFAVTGTACGQDVSGDYMLSELIEPEGEFALQQAVEATYMTLADFYVGALFAFLELGGESGAFDIPSDCEGGGTTQYTGTLTVISEEQTDISMDVRTDGCQWFSVGADGAVNFGRFDGTIHYEGTTASIVISGQYTYSGTLSGECSVDLTVTSSVDDQTLTVTGTACGQDVAGDYSDLLEPFGDE